MTKRKLLLPALTGIVASSAIGTVGTFDLPLGYRYHEINMVYADGGSSPNAFTAMFGDIIVYRNGQAERTHTSAELEQLNTLNGSQYGVQAVGSGAAQRATQTIFFAEPWRKDKSDTDFMAWSADKANGFNSFQLKMTLLIQFPTTATIQAWARVDAPIAPPAVRAQSVKKVYRQQFPATGTSNDITTLDARDGYQTIVMKNPTGAYIQYATLKQTSSSGQIVHERVHQQDNVADLTNMGLNPPSSQTAGAFGYALVLDADDPINSALPASGESPLWLKLEYSAAASGNVIALIERLGPLD